MKDTDNKLVVLFGRTNVGKSTLFNCLTEKKEALVSRQEGTTRDANRGIVGWQGRSFDIVDTGGIIDQDILKASKKEMKHLDDIDLEVQARARLWLKDADLIILLTDARAGLLPGDREMAAFLKRRNWHKKTILAANKADSPRLRMQTAEFNQLGLGEPWPISATNGSGSGDLLDEVLRRLDLSVAKAQIENEEKKHQEIRVSIIGKPNVGKSSLINALTGEKTLIVSDTPHTTREPQDIVIRHRGTDLRLIDTAGISRQGRRQARSKRTKDGLAQQSISRSLETLRRADVAVLMLDIHAGITKQEAKLIEEIVNTKTSLIVAANKWDLVEERDTKAYNAEIYSLLPFISWAPIQFCSALTGEKTGKILDRIIEVYEARQTAISDNALARLLNRIVKKHLPTKGKGTKHPHVYELKQVNAAPPVFMVRVGAKESLHFSYLRFIENRIREKFGFSGTPITMYVEKNRRVHGQQEK